MAAIGNKAFLSNKTEQNVPSELKTDVGKIIGECMASVFKEYLPYVSDAYSVCKIDNSYSPSEMVAYFDITKFVLEKDAKVIEKLKNVYHLLAYTGYSLGLIINRKKDACKISLAVGIGEQNSEKVKNLARNIRDGILGNFPGSECSRIYYYSDGIETPFYPLNENSNFGSSNFNSVGIVSNIASDFDEGFKTQCIEKIIDGVKPQGDKEYTIFIVASALSGNKLELKKDSIYDIYTKLSPFAKQTKSWGSNEGKSTNFNAGIGVFAPLKESPVSMLASLAPNINLGHSWGKSVGVNNGESIEVTNYGVSHTLEVIDKQMNRMEECEALGLWDMAAYVFSPDYELVNEVSHMYMSLTQGKDSYFERPAINSWNAQSNHGERREEIKNIRSYLIRMQHPIFVKRADVDLSTYFNSDNWPKFVSCTSEVSGSELARAMNFPITSVPGLPVITCAPFGREISSYDNQSLGSINIGCIHHMHKDEDMRVTLSDESLTSHVFVTGSTGSGKSNTVYKMLEEIDTNFLVIEPAKGEYRYAFGNDVNKFGTNYMMGDILKINPFVFPSKIHVYEHVDRLLEVFNVCWPMYAAMPAVLKNAILRAYEKTGWNLRTSKNDKGKLYPTFQDVCDEIDEVIQSSDYSDENKGNYRGSLKTRLESLTNGINGLIFCEGNIDDSILFDEKTIVDLSRVGSAENKSLIMGILVIKLQEYRMCNRDTNADESLKHITVIEEAHNLLRVASSSSSPELGGGIASKSVEMIANSIAEMRTYGEGFIIVDQAPGLLDASVIRNTNTKIIMRLPDQSDRELVGRAANLNEDQIAELSKLQRGVAAVYQNEWIEPVLCHIDKYDHKFANTNRPGSNEVGSDTVSNDELRLINNCMFNKDYNPRKSDYSFIDSVEKLAIPDSLKALMIDYYRATGSQRIELHREAAYRYFKMDRIMSEIDSEKNYDDAPESITTYLRKNYHFDKSSDLSKYSNVRYLFIQNMIYKHILDLKDKETQELWSKCMERFETVYNGLYIMGGEKNVL